MSAIRPSALLQLKAGEPPSWTPLPAISEQSCFCQPQPGLAPCDRCFFVCFAQNMKFKQPSPECTTATFCLPQREVNGEPAEHLRRVSGGVNRAMDAPVQFCVKEACKAVADARNTPRMETRHSMPTIALLAARRLWMRERPHRLRSFQERMPVQLYHIGRLHVRHVGE